MSRLGTWAICSAVEEALATSVFVAAPCVGAAIPRLRATVNWVQATSWAGMFGSSTIDVMARLGLAVPDGAGPAVAGAVMDRSGGSGVNPQ